MKLLKKYVCEKTMPTGGNKVRKRSKLRSQGHWPWCHLKGHNELSMHAQYEVSISYGSKVKVDNRQTKRQTNKQTGQKQYALDHSIRGHKKFHLQLAICLPCKPLATESMPNVPLQRNWFCLRADIGSWGPSRSSSLRTAFSRLRTRVRVGPDIR